MTECPECHYPMCGDCDEASDHEEECRLLRRISSSTPDSRPVILSVVRTLLVRRRGGDQWRSIGGRTLIKREFQVKDSLFRQTNGPCRGQETVFGGVEAVSDLSGGPSHGGSGGGARPGGGRCGEHHREAQHQLGQLQIQRGEAGGPGPLPHTLPCVSQLRGKCPVSRCGESIIAYKILSLSLLNLLPVNPDAGFSAVLRAKREILVGEEISIQYVPVSLGQPQRAVSLGSVWCFECACARCSDPSEFGTYVSALKCQECAEGLLLPEQPGLGAAWRCR